MIWIVLGTAFLMVWLLSGYVAAKAYYRGARKPKAGAAFGAMLLGLLAYFSNWVDYKPQMRQLHGNRNPGEPVRKVFLKFLGEEEK